ncbi:MAG TPA: undecaprenyl-diphosphate phosphatase, partial [Terrimicrobiaceae bacterium]
IILGLVQGAAELLPVSSSAHVIVAEKLLGLDPSTPEMTFLLVMLHTGTMFAVIVYFWKSWRVSYFSNWETFRRILINVVIATVATGVVGLLLKTLIERVFLSHHGDQAEVEMLFSQLPLIAAALFAVGLLIIYAGMREERQRGRDDISPAGAGWIGVVQGLCLPFRGFSRSGATISTSLLLGIDKRRAEEFSFALAVVLTPVIIAKELLRLVKANETSHLLPLLQPGLIGMVFSFFSGLAALWLLSRWLEEGRWKFFGYYCLVAACVVFALSKMGY